MWGCRLAVDTMPGMDPVLAAQVWHYWIGVAIVLLAVVAVVGTFVGYLVKVSSAKYPRR